MHPLRDASLVHCGHHRSGTTPTLLLCMLPAGSVPAQQQLRRSRHNGAPLCRLDQFRSDTADFQSLWAVYGRLDCSSGSAAVCRWVFLSRLFGAAQVVQCRRAFCNRFYVYINCGLKSHYLLEFRGVVRLHCGVFSGLCLWASFWDCSSLREFIVCSPCVLGVVVLLFMPS